MPFVKIIIPKMGESVMEATIIKWLKNEGDLVEKEESIVQIATDKVDSEIVSPFSGILKKIFSQQGSITKIGQIIATIDTDDEVEDNLLFQENIVDNNFELKIIEDKNLQKFKLNKSISTDFKNLENKQNRFYSPLIRNIAQDSTLSKEELDSIPATAKNNRISKSDIQLFLKHKSLDNSNTTDCIIKKNIDDYTINAHDTIIELDRVRLLIGEKMVEAKRIIPHVTSFIEADVTEIVKWRNLYKKTFEEQNNIKLTFTPIFIKAIALALEDMPEINAHFVENKLILKNQVNIGLAVALPNGNLIVPVIKNANKLNLLNMTHCITDLANRARLYQLTPSDITDATYTVSNIGTFGNTMGTPIVSPPQIAVLALGAIIKKPAVVCSLNGDTIEIRHLMFLSHSYDHRVVDGALGGGFSKKVASYLENFSSWINEYEK